MHEVRYYISVFLRRLHYFLLVSVIVSAVSVIAAFTLPPAYESQTRLLLEDPQIPSDLAASTVMIAAVEQLEIIEQRLMTRANLLDVARRQDAFPDLQEMSADEIVDAMRARTVIEKAGSRRDPAPIMTITFEARSPAIAAGVLNEYLTLIERQNVEFRTTRAGNTLQFFEREVERLGEELDAASAQILDFKTRNSDALPDSLDYRLSQQSLMQERLAQISRDISTLTRQRERLVQLFETTGQVGAGAQPELSPAEQRLQSARRELDDALAVYSAENPRVRVLQARVAQLEEQVAGQPAASTPETGPSAREATMLDLQLAEIDARVELLLEQRDEAEKRLASLDDSISRTPAVSIQLEELMRGYVNIETQYNTAVDRLAKASTGERIEVLSRGQRISVIEPPAVPTEPTKPNRLLIAGGGTAFGILAGLGMVVLLELLSRTARRPEDIVRRLGVRPLATMPYLRTGPEIFWKRVLKLAVYLTILIGIPAAVYAVHLYYLPLDLLADRAMNRIGVRW